MKTLNVTLQNFVEFWAVATRPAGSENGLGMSTETAMKELAVLKDLFPLPPEPRSIFDEWQHLANGTSRILTFNVQDFARYKDIEVLNPETIGL